MSAFQDRLSDAMRRKGMSQTELARRIGLSVSAVNHYVKGVREPSSANVLVMAKALGISVEYLMGLDSRDSAMGRQALDGAIGVIAVNKELLTGEDVLMLQNIIADARCLGQGPSCESDFSSGPDLQAVAV